MAVNNDQDGRLEPMLEALEANEAEVSASPEAMAGDNGELLKKEEEIKQLQDRILRLAAEMDNTRKRLEREKLEGINFANESLIRELLPVIDNLERALQHGEKDTNGKGLLDGVRMTLKGFADVLGRFGCTAFESEGKPFDPNFHEAVMQQQSSEVPENCVLQELQKGYTLRDRLVRPAMVIVAKAVSPS